MRVFYLFLLVTISILSANLEAKQRIDYFKSMPVEITENHDIDKVYCDPNNEKLIYYISYDRLYKTEDGVSTVLIDLKKLNEDDEDEQKVEFEKAKKELYASIYQEEKESIEDEYEIDDAEEYYEDEITARTERRHEDEVLLLKDHFRYQKSEKYSNKEKIAPIKSLTFLQDLSSHIVMDTNDTFFISINSGGSFFTQEKSNIESIKISEVSLGKREILFTSNNKLYVFDAKESVISKIDISEYDNEVLITASSYYPYVTLMTNKKIYLLKQEENSLKQVKSIGFTPRNDKEYQLYYFSGKNIFIKTKHSIVIFDIYSNSISQSNFQYYTLNDITFKDDIMYIGTDLGFISFNIYTKAIENISLGLLPEQVFSLSLSKKKNIFVTNNYSIYELKSFKNVSDLAKDKNLFAIMKKVQLTYPPLQEIISESYKYHSISRSKFTSMFSRSKVAPYMPTLKVKYLHPISNKISSAFGQAPNLAEYGSSPYFEAFLYFDLSDWVFNIKEMRVNRLNSEMNELREKLTYEITNYYNSRQVLEVLYILANNLSDKLTFRIQILEQGTLINALSGKNFF